MKTQNKYTNRSFYRECDEQNKKPITNQATNRLPSRDFLIPDPNYTAFSLEKTAEKQGKKRRATTKGRRKREGSEGARRDTVHYHGIGRAKGLAKD